MNTRLCKKCNQDLPLNIEYFTYRKTDKTGFHLYCKKCINKEKRDKRLEKRKLNFTGGSIEGIEGRKCSICKRIFPESLEYFGKQSWNKIGLDTYCKECRRNKNLENYIKNKKQWHVTQKKWAGLKRDKIIEVKQTLGGCKKCGEKRHWILDFHHIDPSQKLFQISQGEAKGWELINEEIKKCILLCKNCHGDFHYLEKKQNMNIELFLQNH